MSKNKPKGSIFVLITLIISFAVISFYGGYLILSKSKDITPKPTSTTNSPEKQVTTKQPEMDNNLKEYSSNKISFFYRKDLFLIEKEVFEEIVNSLQIK